eukprot:976078-Prymnesium_polylepis.1
MAINQSINQGNQSNQAINQSKAKRLKDDLRAASKQMAINQSINQSINASKMTCELRGAAARTASPVGHHMPP